VEAIPTQPIISTNSRAKTSAWRQCEQKYFLVISTKVQQASKQA
jgi:hypothetical protein